MRNARLPGHRSRGAYNWHWRANHVANLLVGVGTVSVMSLRDGEDRVVKGQLAALGVPLLQLGELLLDLLLNLLLLLLLGQLLDLLDLLDGSQTAGHLERVLADAAAIRAVGRGRIGEPARAADPGPVAAVVGR